jgi:hypothetical protein
MSERGPLDPEARARLEEVLRDPSTWETLESEGFDPVDVAEVDVVEVPIPMEGNVSYVGEPPTLPCGRQARPQTVVQALVFVGQAIYALVAAQHNWERHREEQR